MIPLHALLLVAASLPARAGLPPDTGDMLQAELDRNFQQLRIPDAPPLYYLSFRALFYESFEAEASFGALVATRAAPLNELGVAVRVGSPHFDNSGLGGWETGFGRAMLPAEITPAALRQTAWLLTDDAYKEAVEQYARKKAVFEPAPDYPGDFSAGHPVQADHREPTSFAPEVLQTLALRLSGAIPQALPFETVHAEVAQEMGHELVMDTEGTRVWTTHAEVQVCVVLQVRADDGMLLTDQVRWMARKAEDLPPEDEMVRTVRDVGEALQATARAPLLDSEYIGPVLFEDEAAAALFRVLLVPQIEGTPPAIPFESRWGNMGEGFLRQAVNDDVRVGRRVLPDGWSVVDDPVANPDHPASFSHDLEGTPAQAVVLVRDGIVRDLLMSRVPRRGLPESNGHARGALGDRPAGRATITKVSASHHLSERRLHRRALAIAREYGLDHVMIVRRFQEDPARLLGGSPGAALPGDEGTTLPLPVQLVRHGTNGQEEIVRGAAFTGVERWALRDIEAAGASIEATFLAPFRPGGQNRGLLSGMPTLLDVPEVLVGEMEIVPIPPNPRDLPVLPRPEP